MGSLLHEALGSILSDALVGLTEDRVQWLSKYVVIELPGESSSHEKLHSFNGIFSLGSSIEIDRESRNE